ncbi:hypothetical protein GALMADRAFT_143833 [Galerina marginata CBS 339.88]|uniref:Uncharacterized protein n=1 Tax=Galerina marginata (strain CBS 339.88) TaxID=685588 RepID=A0A067SNF7_GALM3|nr:hypothetical protein GALMADRAFT_143833 [Galerina marginata CBS 339.88]
MGFSHIHVVHKPHKRNPVQLVEKRADNTADNTACSNFYISPQMSATVDSLQPLPITWNTSCLAAKDIDIYLYSPGSQYPRIHVWEGVALSRGTYQADLMPRWWNATASQSLQISIVPAGQPSFMSSSYFPGGPVFTATYTAPASGTPPSADLTKVDSGITQVNDAANAKKAMTPGKKAAAALIPLLFVILCIGAYIKTKRSKNKDKRKRWSEAVDKRMSTISTDWKSVTAAGANAAIRNSMAVGARNSSFSFGGVRPSSTVAVEGEETTDRRSMSQLRTGVGLRNPAALSSTERVSRVSFAPDTRVSRVSFADSRPSGESRRTRAFHSAYIPPVPALPDHAHETQETQDDPNDDESEDNNTSGSFSPRQTQGAMTLTPEDIRSRIAAGKARNAAAAQEKDITTEKDTGFAELMPALAMMRTGNTDASGNDDLLFATPASPPPAYPKPTSNYTTPMASPVMATMPMQPMPANVMSPDEMLRAYAERKKSMSMAAGKGLTTASISYPMPVANTATPTPSTNNMRVLYNAATGNVSPTHTGSFAGSTDYTPSEYSAADAYTHAASQHQQYPFGHHPNGSIGVGAYGGAQYSIGDDEDDSSAMGRQPYMGHAA